MSPTTGGLGPLGRRLLLAFVLVAVSSVVVLTVAALIGVGRGVQVAQQADREQVAASAASAAADAYRHAGGWSGADLDPVLAIAQGAGARAFVLDDTGSVVLNPGGGAGGGGPQGQGMGSAAAGQTAVTAPVTVDGQQVGAVRLLFVGTATGTRARDVAWSWIGVAALVALLVAVLASWLVSRRLVKPIHAMTSAAHAFAAGDRQARAGVRGPTELGELGAAFDGMADAVARSEQERRNLTADVAHELRTPLAALQAGLEELRDGLVEPTPEGLAGLHDQSLRLGRVVSDLAELSAVESAGLSLRRSVIDLTQVGRDELTVREPQLRAAGLGVSRQLDGAVMVHGDADRLHQAVGNLLANAARYCRPGDDVSVTAAVEGDQAVLRVADTGPGIPADELPHVFDRLWRGHGADQVAGSGIGLAVAREIVAAHGGTITADSPAGRGTTITIRLPCTSVGPVGS